MDFLEQLNPRQREAVEHTEGPLLILAGAGSGKTRVITCRIAHLIRNLGVSPARILAVTFTNKAAGEMRERVAQLLGAGASPPWVSTFHSFCVRLLRRDGAPLGEIRPGFTTAFSIYDDAEQQAVVKAAYRELGLDEKFLPYRSAVSRISHAKNQHISPEEYYSQQAGQEAERVAVIYEKYQATLRRANALDFDDLLLEAVRLLRHDQPTRRRLADRFLYLMVDEYQDTNRVQYELIRLLAEPRRNLCVVGDEDQSIYGWRGADIRNILDFERDYPGAALVRLEQNYRSTKNILDASGSVVANNEARKGKTLWTESGAGSPIVFYTAEDTENEALFIAQTIEQHLTRNPGERAAVLYRTNFQSRPIEEALRRAGRKYLLVGGLSFYQRAEVKDMLAYLRAGLAPQDSFSLLRIINTPARGIGRSTIEQIESYGVERGLPLWEALQQMAAAGAFSTRAQAAIEAFRGLMGELRSRLASDPLPDVLVWLKERTGYQGMLQDEGTIESQGRLENLNELINAAADAAQRGDTPHEFLDQAALVADTDELDTAAAVTLLTLHSAKGLEFPLVILAGLEEGVFPHSRSLVPGDGAGLEEERRLCYVGMTRARKQLVMTRALYRRRFGGGEFEDSRPSRFLREVPVKLVQDLTPARQRRGFGGEDEDDLDLYVERREARQMARRSTYTGKTYNSVENIAEFFAARGKTPAPRAAAPAPVRSIAKPPARGFRAGARIRHPKYGEGIVMRREGDGDDAKITVNFPRHGLKKLIQKYATLQQE